MKSMQSKYQHDPQFRACVDMLEAMIHNHRFTPSEMREMAVMASINYEMRRGPRHMVITQEEADAFMVLQELAAKENDE